VNSSLRQLLIQSEGRFLNDTETAAMRAWAVGMGPRLETARRVEAAEDRIAGAIVDAFMRGAAVDQRERDDADAKTARDVKLTLRYMAMAHVRDDLPWFRTAFAEWIGEMFRALAPQATLVILADAMRAAIDEHLDPMDGRALRPYVEAFDEELRK
jgi:hypothetical protein